MQTTSATTTSATTNPLVGLASSTSSTSPTSSTSSTTGSSSGSSSRTDLGQKDIFLKLLVAQMQYQNPEKPQDPTQMATQLAQFNMVDQQTQTNQLLTQMANQGGTSGTANDMSASWLGHTVTVNQNKIHFDGTTPQNFIVNLPSNASSGYIAVLDANGNPVRTTQISSMPAGANPVTWNGTMDNGAAAPAGDYTIQVTATDLQGQPVKATVERTGTVDAVQFASSGTQLMVGGIPATTADITEIRK